MAGVKENGMAYVTNCTIKPREGDPILFEIEGDVINPKLDGYAIIPVEEYNDLIKNKP